MKRLEVKLIKQPISEFINQFKRSLNEDEINSLYDRFGKGKVFNDIVISCDKDFEGVVKEFLAKYGYEHTRRLNIYNNTVDFELSADEYPEIMVKIPELLKKIYRK